MKKFIVTLCVLALFGCKNETMEQLNAVKNQVKNTSSVMGNISEMEKNAKEMEKNMEDLKKLTPFSSETFKNWLPDEIDGMQRSSYEFQQVMGSNGQAKYANESGDKTFELSIIDGAGEQGSAIFATTGFFTGMYGGFESENDTKKEEIVERDGNKSMETYYKNENKSDIKVIMHDRFIVQASGQPMQPDELFNLVKKLNISNLAN